MPSHGAAISEGGMVGSLLGLEVTELFVGLLVVDAVVGALVEPSGMHAPLIHTPNGTELQGD